LKTKNTGHKSSTSTTSAKKAVSRGSEKAKSSVGSKSASKPVRRTATPVASVVAKKQIVPKEKVTAAEKVSLTDRLSKSKLVKSAAVVKLKAQRAKLKLVAKGVGKVPVTKITRSEGAPQPSNVITGRFGAEQPAAKPVLAVRAVVERTIEGQITKPTGEVVNFKVGDKIVYPGHGVGEIEGVRTTILGGEEHHIYNIKILDTGMKVMVPLQQAAAVGLRRIIDKKAIDTVYDILRDRNFKIDTQTWNRRFREYSQKIKTGSVFEIAMVLRDLSVLSADKELSFGEKKMLDMAEALLVSEIAIAKARPQDKIAGELKSLFV
jgi:CarD family transcriptional regulator